MSNPRSGSEAKSTAPDNSSRLRQPELKPVDLANITDYMAETKRGALTNAQKEDVEKYLAKDKAILALNSLLKDVIRLQNHFGSLPGLTPQQTEEFRELMQIRKSFMDTHKKGKYDGPAIKNFIANEKNIVSFQQSMQWWGANLATMKKLDIWEDINTLVINTAKSENIPDTQLTDRLHKLNDIKNEWAKHQLFASFSSENLVTFHDDYLAIMEKTLVEFLSDKECPESVKDYLLNTLQKLKAIRKQCIYSMFVRLQCVEFYSSIENDDILHFLVDKIEADCGIHFHREGKRPDPRNGLVNDIMASFVKHIREYASENPTAISLTEQLEKMNMVLLPHQWMIEPSDELNKSILLKNPLIIYCLNQFNNFIDVAEVQIKQQSERIDTATLTSNQFILAKVKKLIGLAKKIIADTHLDTPIDKKVVLQIEEQEKQLEKMIGMVSAKITIKIRNQIHAVLENVYSEKKIEYNNIEKLFDYMANGEKFEQMFLDGSYDADKDIILALATKIKHLIEKGGTLSDAMIEKTIQLFVVMFTGIAKDKIDKLRSQLKILPEHVKNIHANDDPYILHYITHHIEASLLSSETIRTSLKRHQYISELYNEKWPQGSNEGELLDYVKLVFMPLIHECPTITLDNFDIDCTHESIQELEKQMNGPSKKSDMISTIKKDYEMELSEKLNNIFSIKKYLYTNNEKIIDPDKLIHLLERVNQFFTHPEYKNKLISTIEHACIDLVKGYLINIIQTDTTPDFTFLEQINSILGKNIYQALADDGELTRLMMNHMELYNGTNNHLGRLLTDMFANNKHIQRDDNLADYAKKRLNFINSSGVIDAEDYQFFHYYKTRPATQSVFKKYSEQHKNAIDKAVTHRSIWNRKTAMLIELFGSDDDINTYRFYKIRELLAENSNPKVPMAEKLTSFNQLYSSINPQRLIKNKFVRPDNIVHNKTTLNTYLDYAASEKAWSPILECIFDTCGSDAQLEMLHYKCIAKLISAQSNFLQHELGKKFLACTEVNRYSAFLGKNNVQKICAEIERMLLNLEAFDAHTNSNQITKNDYETHLAILTCIKPLSLFYQTVGKDAHCKSIFTSLPDIEKKIQLHYTLQTTIKNQLSLLSVASENTTLHNLILSLTQNVIRLNHSHYVTSKNLSNFMAFCNTEIFDQINHALTNKNFTLTFPIVAMLTNLLDQLPSNNLKNQLILAHKQEATDNPVWLRLINHLDENHTVLSIINSMSSSAEYNKLGTEFEELLHFSKQFTRTKHNLHQFTKKLILRESGYPLSNNKEIDFNSLLQSDKTTDKQLLSIWKTCLRQLANDQLQYDGSQEALRYVIRLATKTANEIILRARQNATLLAAFLEAQSQLPLIHKQFCHSDTTHETKKSDFLSFWQSKSDSEKILDPLVGVAQRTAVTALVHVLEKYVAKNAQKDKRAILLNLANDAIFFNPNSSIENRALLVKDKMGIQHDNPARVIAATIPLYHNAIALLRSNASIKLLRGNIDTLTHTINTDKTLASTKECKALLAELNAIANFNPLISNDRDFHIEKSWKWPFSLQSA